MIPWRSAKPPFAWRAPAELSSQMRAHAGTTAWWLSDGVELAVEDLRLAGAASVSAAAAGALRAPMHGRVTQVLVAPGATVAAGTLLLVMEAMKMEHQLVAPRAGSVVALQARVGDQVAARQVLIELGP